MPIRENLATPLALDGSSAHPRTKVQAKKDENRIDFGAAFATMLTPAPSSSSFALPRPITRTASESAIDGVTRAQGAPAAPAHADKAAKPGFWSGLVRAAEGLLTSSRADRPVVQEVGAAPRQAPQNDPQENRATSSLEEAPAGRNAPDDGPTVVRDARASWLQLIEAAAPLDEVPGLISKLNGRAVPVTTEAKGSLAPAAAKEDPLAATEVTAPIAAKVAQADHAAALAPEQVSTPLDATVNHPAHEPAPREGTHATSGKVAESANQPPEPRAGVLAKAPEPFAGAPLTITPPPAMAAQPAAILPAAVAAPTLSPIHEAITGAPRAAAATPLRPANSSTPLAAPQHATTLRLDLAEGSLAHANVRERAGVVEVRIATNNLPVAQQLESAIGTLRRTLDASGLHLQSADVSYDSGGGGGSSDRGGDQRGPERGEEPGSGGIFKLSEVGK